MFYYAQLNNENICVGLSQSSKESDNPILIKLDKYDNSFMGKRYDKGRWYEAPQPKTLVPLRISNQDIAQQLSDLEIRLILAGVID